MKKNIVIIHYNTPSFTECLVKSVNRYVKDAKIYIFDNSDKLPFVAEFENVTIFDNTKGQIIDFNKWLEKFPFRTKTSAGKNNYASAKHCYSVHKCMELIDEPFVLLDSDVLLKQDISFLFSDSDIFIGTTELWKAKACTKNHVSKAKLRAVPYLSFINTELCKKHGVKYFNESCIYGLSANGDSYDTGTYFFEQITKKKLKWTKINISNYIVHYKAGSWVDKAKKFDGYKQISGSKWLENNKKYWFSEKVIKNKNVVYTCITGGYDTLTEPEFVSDGFDYVCFTDNVDLNSDVWEIRPLPKETDSLSQVKKQRYVKLNPHLLLSDYDISIWVDGNVKINGDLNTFMKEYINDFLKEYKFK